MNQNYIFQSARLGFRNWDKSDLTEFHALNSNEQVMEHFPAVLSIEETASFIDRLQAHYLKRGFNYFAVEILATGEFIGFTGLAYQTYATDFTPAVDIGWRLKPTAWGNGYATEGARRCLAYAFEVLEIERIISTCVKSNVNSERVMQKIGMTKMGYFKHPRLKEFPTYENCVWYEIKNPNY